MAAPRESMDVYAEQTRDGLPRCRTCGTEFDPVAQTTFYDADGSACCSYHCLTHPPQVGPVLEDLVRGDRHAAHSKRDVLATGERCALGCVGAVVVLVVALAIAAWKLFVS